MKYYMERFFQIGNEVPVAERFTFDSAERGITLLILLTAGFLCIYALKQCDKKQQTHIMKLITSGVLLFYSLRYFGNLNDYIYGDPEFLNWHEQMRFIFRNLPLNLCNLSMFINLIAVYTKRKTFMALSYSLMMPGAILALTFPERPYLESVRTISFDYIQFYLVHGLAVLIPVLFLVLGWYKPSLSNIKSVVAFVGIIFIFAFTTNYIFNANHCFLRYASPETPMEILYDKLPQPFYGLSLYVLGCVICFIMLLTGEIIVKYSRMRKRNNERKICSA